MHTSCPSICLTPPRPVQYYLDNDQKLKKFVPIIKDSVVYPAIYDANRVLLSLPPIINGAHSAVCVCVCYAHIMVWLLLCTVTCISAHRCACHWLARFCCFCFYHTCLS